MATPKQIGARAWNREVNRVQRHSRTIRQTVNRVSKLLLERPVPVRLISVYLNDISFANGEIVDAVQSVDQIVRESEPV